MIATIRALTGRQPRHYFGDTHDPARPAVRDLKQEVLRVFRTRVVNPKWLEGVTRHGYKGGLELAATVDYLFGFDATSRVVEDWMYEQTAAAYALSPAMQEFFARSNPWALHAIAERLLEAAQRGGMWKAAAQPETAGAASCEQNASCRARRRHWKSEAKPHPLAARRQARGSNPCLRVGLPMHSPVREGR